MYHEHTKMTRIEKCRIAAPPSRSIWVVAAMCLLTLTWIAVAQPPTPAGPAEPSKAPTSLDNLAVEQGKIADKYARLEQLLIRMSELEATSNPQRAALLKRAAQQSSDKLTRQQLNTLVKLLAPPAQLKRAVDDQQEVITDLRALLELLQSENRADRLKSEQTRIKDYIKEVERLIRLQQGVQGRTEGGDDAKKLVKDQEQVADRTGQLSKQIQETEQGAKAGSSSDDKSKSDAKQSDKSGKPSEEDSSQKKPGDKSSGEKGDKDTSEKDSSEKDPANKGEKGDKGKPSAEPSEKSSDSKSGEKSSGEKASGKNESGEKQKSDGQSKSGGKQNKSPSKGEPGEPSDSSEQPESQESAEQKQDQANPARKQLQAAEEKMREAQRKLAEAKQKDATKDQEEAREALEKAKAELERILRQMREEEIERTLAMLEGRFRRMLETQLKVYESTKRLDKIPAAQRSRDIDIQAGKLGFEEGKLAVDADKALLLLREEGSSVAFPETVELMRDDMQQVADRLSAVQIDQMTQGIEEEIIQTLEELIASLQKAQQDLKDKKPQPPMPQQPMDPSQRPLVDQLAELKMIRALQMRINTRTQRFSRLLENIEDPVGKAIDSDLRDSLTKLAEMEKRVHEITRSLVLGKNE